MHVGRTVAQGSLKLRIALAAGVVLVALVVLVVAPQLVSGRSVPDGSPTTSVGAPRQTTAAPSPSETPPTATPSASGSPAPSSVPPPPSPQSRAQQILATMSVEQRVGQIMMVSSPTGGPDQAALDAMSHFHIGNVFLKGRTTAGASAVANAVKAVRAQATPDATAGVGQFVSTDQEGGQIQILNGQGFSALPSALAQGGMDPAALRGAAAQWGRELASAGVNVDLAPVLDTVPSAEFAAQNTPIGKYQREFGFTPSSVSDHGLAVIRGLADAGIATTPKHFPGLGRVTSNTDFGTDVTDPATGRHDPYIAPFADAIRAGASWTMISNAFYPAIDPDHYAVFSPTVIQGMLRGDLGFRGIVISDDVCDATQLSQFALEHRGSDFLAAGGTMVLCTDQRLAPRVWQGMVDRAKGDPAFAQTVDAAALAVLEAKDQAGLLPR